MEGVENRKLLAQNETDLGLGALGIGLGLALGALRWSLERAQTTHLVEDSLGVELGLEALESAIDRFALTDYNFWHNKFTCFLLWEVETLPDRTPGQALGWGETQGSRNSTLFVSGRMRKALPVGLVTPSLVRVRAMSELVPV